MEVYYQPTTTNYQPRTINYELQTNMRLLIIGELGGQIAVASQIAQRRGAKVVQCHDVDSALESLRSGKSADLAMIDVQLDVARFINALASEHISMPVIGCGTQSDSASAVKAIKAGAREYIPLPPDEELIAAVLEAITAESNEVICASVAMQNILKLCDRVAASEANILITGESGTGKEVIAKYLHKKSKRAAHDMIALNCAAIPENLLESELFGHEKGAFTGAIARRIGKFEEANGSTLLLDEISEMDMRLQAKLLRAIQERVIDRVGGSKPVSVNIRIIATSNRNLQEEVKNGRFREDLFFRLNVINVALPPLRARKEDLKLFATYFINKYAKVNGIPAIPLSSAAFAKLENYRFPGNVRELENILHRSLLIATGQEITQEDISLSGDTATSDNNSGNSATSDLVGRTMQSVEKEHIINTLDHCIGNRTHAANILGISIRTLRNKLKEYEVA